MNYIGINSTPHVFNQLVKRRKDISFVLTDPSSWNTHRLLDIIWRVAGGIVENVTLFNSYRHPETGEVTHSYHIDLWCKNSHSHAGQAFPVGEVNDLVRDIEEEIEATLPVRFRSKHKPKGAN